MKGYGRVSLKFYLQHKWWVDLLCGKLFEGTAALEYRVYSSLYCIAHGLSFLFESSIRIRCMDKIIGSMRDRKCRSTWLLKNIICRCIPFDYHTVNILITISLKQISEERVSFSKLVSIMRECHYMLIIICIRLFIDSAGNNELYIIAVHKCFFTSARN